MQPRSKPDIEWLVNAIEVFMGNVPGEDDRDWSSTDLAYHILGNWLTIEDAQVRALVEVANECHDAFHEIAGMVRDRGETLVELTGNPDWQNLPIRLETVLKPFE